MVLMEGFKGLLGRHGEGDCADLAARGPAAAVLATTATGGGEATEAGQLQRFTGYGAHSGGDCIELRCRLAQMACRI